jgi:hypothetical protein
MNGDAAAGLLKRSGLAGTVTVWADVLHDGPVPPDLPPAQWRELRARFLWRSGFIAYEEALRCEERWDAGLASFAEHDEIVLWFEHDLFDQLLLIRQLDWFGRQDWGGQRLSLICIGEYPGVADFVGLGQLTPDQLAALFERREPLTRSQLEVGRVAWRAFTSPDPTEIERLLERDTSPLPFLADALHRHLQEFPWTRDGLPRTERQILRAMETGARSPRDVYLESRAHEERIYMGDWSFWWRVLALASARDPAVELDVSETGRTLPSGELRLTETGRAVLAGRSDWVELNGIDRWLGGVHLQGDEAMWRWDDGAGRLVQS